MQSFLPTGISSALQNNYIAPNHTGLTNWSTTDRIDYNISNNDKLFGRFGHDRVAIVIQPVDQRTNGRKFLILHHSCVVIGTHQRAVALKFRKQPLVIDVEAKCLGGRM